MMRDRPRGADLVAEARRVLTETVLPGLAPETRYQALMVIRAMDLAEQEFRASPGVEAKLSDQLRRLLASEGTRPELFSLVSKHIRSGAFDASEELYAFLRLVVAFKLKETNPSKISGELKDSLDGLYPGGIHR
jgi:hypothetical protein